MKNKWFVPLLILACLAGCRQTSEVVLKKFSLDSTKGLVTRSGIEIDTQNYLEGTGSLKVVSRQPATVRLFEFDINNVENTRLIYSAFVKLEDFKGQVFLEMWCCFSQKGEFFSRNLNRPLSGTIDWTEVTTPFYLKEGESPNRIKLNLILNGTGTLWIDRITLSRSDSAGD
jgi:hypothetical protein